jgi:hypothetical protein
MKRRQRKFEKKMDKRMKIQKYVLFNLITQENYVLFDEILP